MVSILKISKLGTLIKILKLEKEIKKNIIDDKLKEQE